MIFFDSTTVFGVQPALLGMRNPMNSWDKSDSIFENGRCFIGKNDRKLIRSLVKAGKDHRKFLRMITVHINITAPLYWWKEFDTYKIGTVANSCSTMHKLHDKEFELDDFSHENLTPYNTDIYGVGMLKDVINILNQSRDLYLKTKDKKYWWNMIQLLPSSYNQKRTIMLNFETMMNIYDSRKNHKLDEWHYFCDWIEDVLYQSGFACILDLDVIKTENE